MKKIRIYVLAVTTLLCLSSIAKAQPGSMEIAVGGAASWVSKRSVDARFSPAFTPLGGLIYNQSISKKVGLRSGVLYQQKQSRMESHNHTDSLLLTSRLKQRTTLHYMSIPLQLTISPENTGKYQWRFAAGMNYGFLVSAFTISDSTSLQAGAVIFEERRSLGNYIAASKSRDENRGNDRSELYLFTPSLRFDVSCTFYQRLSASVFYEYNLSDISSNGGVGRVHLHTAGLYLSYRLF